MRPSHLMKHLVSGAQVLVVAVACACGGSNANVKGDVPPPPKITKSENALPGPGDKSEPKREVATDTRKDYDSLAKQFAATDKAHGWNDQACRQSADRFAAV